MESTEAAVIMPVIAGVLVILVAITKLVMKLRFFLPKRVNCWFCNKNTSVPYKYKDSWKCPCCEQYNGFESDGGYNRIIPAQYHESLNKPLLLRSCTKKVSREPNELCKYCSINQELKLAQLRSFVPIEPSNYDEEVDIYSGQLELAYKLCSKCEIFLDKKLNKQKKWLDNLYQKKDVKCTQSTVKKHSGKFFKIYITIASSVGLFYIGAKHFRISLEIKKYILSYIQLLVNNIHPYIDMPWLADLSMKLSAFNDIMDLTYLPIVLYTLCIVIQLSFLLERRDIASFLNVITWLIVGILTNNTEDDFLFVGAVQMFAGGVFFITNVLEIKKFKSEQQNADVNQNTPLSSNTKSSGFSSSHKNPPISEVKPTRSKSLSPAIPKIDKPDKNINSRPSSSTSIGSSKVTKLFGSSNIKDPQVSSTTDDFGKLDLGTIRNRFNHHSPFERKLYGNKVSNDLFRPVLSPPKLSVYSFNSDVYTRTSSHSSGIGSSVSQFCDQRPLSIASDFDDLDDRSTISPCRQSVYNSLCHYPINPYQSRSYYQLAQYHQGMVYHPVPTPAVLDTYKFNREFNLSFFPRTLNCLVPAVLVLVLTNLALFGIVVYKEFLQS
uniref:Ima1 N-terminal domain-containing protein n=1 Tax=Clastoptera arizonana TaxID=38151 RepID=A0A1B6CP90_9HEMI